MNYATAEQIVKLDAQFNDGQDLFERIMHMTNLSDAERQVCEELLWSMLAVAFVLGYVHKSH